MILSFIQDIESNSLQQADLSSEHIQPLHGSFPVSETAAKENIPSGREESEKQDTAKPDRNKEPDRIEYSYDNSFESKYVHFKEKIEKDRLAWETLANRK